MKYNNTTLIFYYGCVFSSIPRLFVYLRMRMYTSKQHSCVQGPLRDAFEPGAFGLPYSCTPPMCVPDVLGALAVWRHTKKKKDSRVIIRE